MIKMNYKNIAIIIDCTQYITSVQLIKKALSLTTEDTKLTIIKTNDDLAEYGLPALKDKHQSSLFESFNEQKKLEAYIIATCKKYTDIKIIITESKWQLHSHLTEKSDSYDLTIFSLQHPMLTEAIMLWHDFTKKIHTDLLIVNHSS